ncbi:MAG: hypothetical protein H0U71_09860 [Gammaproteobacteria bacterium]|nr:hypothetical protein [Gammaproteobacteria bacterium]
MKIKQVSLFLGMLIINFSIYANLKSSDITLASGTIKPREILILSLSKLSPDVSYFIVAKINDPNNKKNQVIIKVKQERGRLGCYSVFLNDKFMANAEDGPQLRLTQADNTIDFLSMDPYFTTVAPITFTNLDETDSITLTAVATPVVNDF